MTLRRETHTAVDISGGAAVLTFTYSGTRTLQVSARVELGDNTAPIIGGQNYQIVAKVDGVPVTPVSQVLVPGGQTRAIMQSRALVLEQGDVVTVEVTGAPADVAVNTVAILVDMTPARTEDLFGDGSVLVNHDYPAADALLIKSSAGPTLGGAVIKAFLAADYDAGNRSSSFVRGQTRSNADGEWVNPLLLDPGDYTLLVSRSGFSPLVHHLTVN